MQHYDLATDKDGDLPSKPEMSERALMKVMRRCQKPIALFIDDGHDLALQEGTCDNTPQARSLLETRPYSTSQSSGGSKESFSHLPRKRQFFGVFEVLSLILQGGFYSEVPGQNG
jgi:hypothetical protein